MGELVNGIGIYTYTYGIGGVTDYMEIRRPSFEHPGFGFNILHSHN
jgi:hypothetical protein